MAKAVSLQSQAQSQQPHLSPTIRVCYGQCIHFVGLRSPVMINQYNCIEFFAVYKQSDVKISCFY